MFEKLASMQQRGAIEDYVQEFEMLVAQDDGGTTNGVFFRRAIE